MWRFSAEMFPRRRRPTRNLLRMGGRWLLPALGLAVASFVGSRMWRRA